jgi:hypothetical protein
VLVKADERNALRDRGRVVRSRAGALCRWEQADPLVAAERRGRDAGAASELHDRHQAVLRQKRRCAGSPTGPATAGRRTLTLKRRMAPGPYRITVRAHLDHNRLSPPARRYLRVLG